MFCCCRLQVNTACVRYQSSMAEVSDQVKMLYRDYANNAANWRLERSSTEKQVGHQLGTIVQIWLGLVDYGTQLRLRTTHCLV